MFVLDYALPLVRCHRVIWSRLLESMEPQLYMCYESHHSFCYMLLIWFWIGIVFHLANIIIFLGMCHMTAFTRV